jgi:hypothetical protein
VPELTSGPAAVREVLLAERPDQVPAGVPWVALGAGAGADPRELRLADYIRPDERQVRQSFVDWMGALNMTRASLGWWAHTASAKNLLSSPLGNQVLELLGLQRLLARTPAPRIAVVGATSAQRKVIASLVAGMPGVRVEPLAKARTELFFPLARLGYQFARMVVLWPALRRARSEPGADVHVLTYGDEALDDGRDAFFGPLAELLLQRQPALRTQYHVFMQGSYRRILARIGVAGRFRYAPLFAELGLSDLCVALVAALRARFAVDRWTAAPRLGQLDLQPVLRAALIWDLAKGGYFYNLLVYRAARRLGQRLKPAVLLYPYEAKSLEKAFLLGIKAAHPPVRVTGYQHTAITPRHTTLLFAEGEAARTPLPDRVVTMGSVTQRYLKEQGRYPDDLLRSGFALRQVQRPALPRRSDAALVRLLFVTSSSVAELAAAGRCLLAVAKRRPAWKLAIRPHPEFPLRWLPAELANELRAHASDFSGSALTDNLHWSDAAVYVSSTAALEALMVGRPVVNLDVGDLLSVDPVIEAVPLHARARSAEEVIAAVERLTAMQPDEFRRALEASRDFTARYVPAPTVEALGILVD